ncbi:hypothetical protein TNIN_265141, partial [Trichonephila inaurata madagascariensis]
MPRIFGSFRWGVFRTRVLEESREAACTRE